MDNENVVYEATDHATFDSKRKGSWANSEEIKTRMNKKITKPLPTILAKLVKDKRIEKKKDARFWRTRKGGGGGFGTGGVFGDRGEPDTTPRGNDYPEETRNPAEDNVRAGLAAMFGGIAGGATGGSSGAGGTQSVR